MDVDLLELVHVRLDSEGAVIKEKEVISTMVNRGYLGNSTPQMKLSTDICVSGTPQLISTELSNVQE